MARSVNVEWKLHSHTHTVILSTSRAVPKHVLFVVRTNRAPSYILSEVSVFSNQTQKPNIYYTTRENVSAARTSP